MSIDLRFEQLLPPAHLPEQAAVRRKLVDVLDSKGEILPSASSPRGRLWKMVNDPDASLDECAKVIQLDSALASRILRIANSGAFGFGAENVAQAITQLGLRFVREQVFNAGVFEKYSSWVLPPEWDNFWLRNIFVASLTERLAGLYGRTNGSEYLAGVIHDVGWLFIASHAPEEYVAIFQSGKPVAIAEAEFLPFSHSVIAAAVAERSRLPARVVSAITRHHVISPADLNRGDKPEYNADFLANILSIADRAADTQKLNIFSPCDMTMIEVQCCACVRWLGHFGKTPDLVPMVEEEMEKARAIFDSFFGRATEAA
jgi:HD-like signal output (HDOD) protein